MIRKAVLPVAGFGTRCLPASKAIPKEMITIVDRPVIQYVVEEAIRAGIKEILLFSFSSKAAIENHFDTHAELEASLEAKGKHALLDSIQHLIPDDVSILSVRQGKPLGLGHAVLCARPLIGDNEPFAVLLPDVLVNQRDNATTNDLKGMLEAFQQRQVAQLMVEEVEWENVERYGIVSPTEKAPDAGHCAPLAGIVEKPSRDLAPSNLAVIGRYALPGEIFTLLENTPPGAGGEIQLTDAIDTLREHSGVDAYRMQGVTYDCGQPLGYMEATLAYGRSHPELGDAFKALLTRYAQES